jgi:hypothetical protein
MAVRTDPDAPRHHGISLLIVDVTSPGITVSPLWGMGDIRTNLTFWDDVRVPAENLIGEEHRGWDYLGTHLDFERITSFTVDALRAVFDDLVDYVKTEDRCDAPLREDPIVRRVIGELSTEIEVLESMTRHALWLVTTTDRTVYESSAVKVFATELRQRLTRLALEIIGPRAQLLPDDDGAPLQGAIYRATEGAVMQTFGAGANEIQRDIIARRALHLPRS